MSTFSQTALERATMYAAAMNLTIDKNFGGGVDGVVLGTTTGTAIKSFRHQQMYQQELSVYHHLMTNEIFSVCDFQIPKLINSSDNFLVIEMTIVTPPFVLDFVGAKLSRPEPFPEDILDEWRAERREVFGRDWPLVQRVIRIRNQGSLFDGYSPGKYLLPLRNSASIYVVEAASCRLFYAESIAVERQ